MKISPLIKMWIKTVFHKLRFFRISYGVAAAINDPQLDVRVRQTIFVNAIKIPKISWRTVKN